MNNKKYYRLPKKGKLYNLTEYDMLLNDCAHQIEEGTITKADILRMFKEKIVEEVKEERKNGLTFNEVFASYVSCIQNNIVSINEVEQQLVGRSK